MANDDVLASVGAGSAREPESVRPGPVFLPGMRVMHRTMPTLKGIVEKVTDKRILVKVDGERFKRLFVGKNLVPDLVGRRQPPEAEQGRPEANPK